MDIREKPILFKGPMVNAVLDDLKSQTRRVMKTQPPDDHEPPFQTSDGNWVTCENNPPHVLKNHPLKCPYKVGQIIWVKEAWAYCYKCASGSNGPYDPLVKEGVIYRQQRDSEEGGAWGTCHPINPKTRKQEFRWRPSIFMFRWASRIDLLVTEVRAQRLQDISAADALAEGVDPGCFNCGEKSLPNGCGCADPQPLPIDSFIHLWNSINSKPRPVMSKGKAVSYVSYPWEEIRETSEHRGKPWVVYGNPMLYATTFRRVKP